MARLKALGAIKPTAVAVRLYSASDLEKAFTKLGHTRAMARDMAKSIKQAALGAFARHNIMLQQEAPVSSHQGATPRTQPHSKVVVGNIRSECHSILEP
jgi:hypothetical protein